MATGMEKTLVALTVAYSDERMADTLAVDWVEQLAALSVVKLAVPMADHWVAP